MLGEMCDYDLFDCLTVVTGTGMCFGNQLWPKMSGYEEKCRESFGNLKRGYWPKQEPKDTKLRERGQTCASKRLKEEDSL